MTARKTYKQGSKSLGLPIVIGGVLLIFAGILIGTIISNLTQSSGTSRPTPPPASIIYSGEALDIASNFLCACGRCGERELVACTCDTALQEKNLIQSLLEKGNDRESVIATIRNMFGYYKL